MNVSKSEIVVLEVLWKEHPLTVGQIIERANETHDWHENTVKTLLSRMLKKKAVERYKDGKRFFYQPLIMRDDIITAEADGFLKQFFEGRMAPLVAHFAQSKKLSKQEVKEIQAILNQLEEKND